MKALTKDQKIRYARNISVESIGTEGQIRLLCASVFVLGCGALGSVVASYLAGAGVGHITLADYDTVDVSNLQRQIQYSEKDAGMSKAEILSERLRAINSDIEVETVETLVTREKAKNLFAGHDFIVDASDNPDTKYMIDCVCGELGLPYCMGGVLGFGGQVMTHVPGSARYSDIFPEGAVSGFTPCSIGGVLGPVAGIIGSIQALEVIKFLTGAGRLLTDRLIMVDGGDLKITELEVRP